MHPEIIHKLLEINRQFYSEFGVQFSATRQRIQPGVREILMRLSGNEDILDLGCGNGEFARTLALTGFHGSYLGLDFSAALLEDAEDQPGEFSCRFASADLTANNWDEAIQDTRFTLITAFAALHHIPDSQLRLEILKKIHRLLAPGGKFIHSNWQFLNSEKLKRRVQPWDAAGLSAADVDEGDYLLDWRSGGAGLRYVHHFSAQELDQLALETGFRVVESFFSDGEGGRLGLYQIWERYENQG